MSNDLPQINFDIMKASEKLLRDVQKFKGTATYREMVATGQEGQAFVMMAMKFKTKHHQLYDNFIAIFKAIVQGELTDLEHLELLLKMRAAVDQQQVSLEDADKALTMKFYNQYKKE